VDHRENVGGPQTLNIIMKMTLLNTHALIAGATLFITASVAEARSYGVSSSSVGRGTKYTSSRGGTAYAGPRGVAAQGANGRTAAVGQRGAAYAGPNGAAASGRYGTAAVTNNGTAYAGRYTASGAAVATRPVAAPLPAGYIRAVPAGSQTVFYGGYNCSYIGGVYYRPVFYGGATVYVVVR
jgi:hypothetical protein